jgi:hydroxyacylglutathione hydrolase
MRRVADGVWQLRGFPPNAINVFLVGDVLVDAATRHAGRRILRQLKGREVSTHLVTHAHPDHQGASHVVCTQLGIPLWCGETDADAVEDPRLIGERQPDTALAQLFHRTMTGPAHPVDRRLHEGDRVGDFTVLDVPGHSAGHIALWREGDRVLILGDVLNSQDVLTGRPGIREPKPYLTPDPERNRESARRLAQLEPQIVCFGHGPTLTDGSKLTRFVDGLPS